MPESWCWDIPLGVKCSANGKHSLPLTCGGMPASIGSVTWSFFIPISHIHSNSQTQVSGRRAQAHSTAGLDLSVMKVNDGLIDEYLVILTAEGETAAEGWSGKGGFVKLVEWSYIRGRSSHGRHMVVTILALAPLCPFTKEILSLLVYPCLFACLGKTWGNIQITF